MRGWVALVLLATATLGQNFGGVDNPGSLGNEGSFGRQRVGRPGSGPSSGACAGVAYSQCEQAGQGEFCCWDGKACTNSADPFHPTDCCSQQTKDDTSAEIFAQYCPGGVAGQNAQPRPPEPPQYNRCPDGSICQSADPRYCVPGQACPLPPPPPTPSPPPAARNTEGVVIVITGPTTIHQGGEKTELPGHEQTAARQKADEGVHQWVASHSTPSWAQAWDYWMQNPPADGTRVYEYGKVVVDSDPYETHVHHFFGPANPPPAPASTYSSNDGDSYSFDSFDFEDTPKHSSPRDNSPVIFRPSQPLGDPSWSRGYPAHRYHDDYFYGHHSHRYGYYHPFSRRGL